MGYLRAYIVVLLAITGLQFFGSLNAAETFSEYNSLFRLIIPVQCWIAVLALANAIIVEDGDHTRRWVLERITLMLGVIGISIVGHASLYRVSTIFGPQDLTGNNYLVESVYFSIVTWTTLGYGDFSPTKSLYLVAASEAMMGYVTMSLLIGLIFFRGSTGRNASKRD